MRGLVCHENGIRNSGRWRLISISGSGFDPEAASKEPWYTWTTERQQDRIICAELLRCNSTNRKLDMRFRLVPKSLTSNCLERRNDRRPALSLR